MRSMRSMRSAIALDPRLFGRGRNYSAPSSPEQAEADTAWSEFKLFATTFLGGFLFVAVYLA